jgi:hypothetical protein
METEPDFGLVARRDALRSMLPPPLYHKVVDPYKGMIAEIAMRTGCSDAQAAVAVAEAAVELGEPAIKTVPVFAALVDLHDLRARG